MYLMRYFHCDFIRFDFYFVSLLFVCLLVCVCAHCFCICIYVSVAVSTACTRRSLCAYTVRTAALPCCLYQFCQMWTKTLKCAKILHKWSSVTAIAVAVDVAVAVGSAFMLSSWSWSCGQRQKSKCCWYWWADECEVKHTPLSLSLSLFRSGAESLLHAWRELQQQKKAWQASPAKGGLPGSSSERRQRRWQRQTKSASGNRVCYWAEHTHMDTHTLTQAGSCSLALSAARQKVCYAFCWLSASAALLWPTSAACCDARQPRRAAATSCSYQC